MKAVIISLVFLSLLLSVSLMLTSPVVAGDPFSGSNIYAQHCASCHGGDGRGEVAGTPSFRGGRMMVRTDADLKNTVRTGKNLMPSYRGLLEEYQIDDVVTYIRAFN